MPPQPATRRGRRGGKRRRHRGRLGVPAQQYVRTVQADVMAPGPSGAAQHPVHWAHGISMGALRGALDQAGLRGLQASAAHFALLWGGDAALYRALGIADVPWRWDADELASDLLHKAVYAAVTGAVYDAMTADSH
jgi:hypothetical protein